MKLNGKSRAKYDPSLKTTIVKEYMRGCSAKEISQKYGVKQRTIYDWCRKARKGKLLSDLESESVNFLTSSPDNSNNQDNKDFENKVESLERRIIELEKIIKYKKR